MKWLLKNFEEIISSVALSIVILVVVFNVTMRYILSASFNWAEEVATIGFAWVVFIGASACYKRGMHIGIDVFVRFLPTKIRRAVSIAVSFLLVISNIYLTYLSLVFSISAISKPTAVLMISYTFVDISATIGFSLMTIHSTRNTYKLLKNKKYLSLDEVSNEANEAEYLSV